jgi:RHS repeat-associated protein
MTPFTQTAVTTWVNDPPTGLLVEKKYQGQSSGVKYTYHNDGKPASRTWRRGNLMTEYEYNSFRDLESITYPDGTPDVVFSNFDRLGRPGTVTEGGNTTTLAYDPQTGEVATTYAASHGILPGLSVVPKSPDFGRPGGYTLSQGSTPLDDVAYDYDSVGRLNAITSGAHQVGYQYYPGTNILRETTHTQAGTDLRVETRHVDLAGRLTGIITTVPNGTGRRTAASAGYLINNRGLRDKLTREDGTSWNYVYNDRREVTIGQKKLANGTLAAGHNFGYLYDAIGNRLWAKSGGNSSGSGQRTVNYTPNALNQYSSITTPGSFDVLVRSPNGVGVAVNGTPVTVASQGTFHRAQATATNTAGAWAALTITSPVGQNSITGRRWLPPATFTPTQTNGELDNYDPDGNLLNDGRWTNTWDAENRLITQTTTPLAAAAGVPRCKVENTYDWQSRRIRKKVSSSTDGTTWTVVSDERFVYERWNQLAVFTVTGSTLIVKESNLWGLDLSGTLQGAGGVSGLLSVTINNQPSTINLFPAYDGNGNIIAWTDSNGVTKQRIDYDPFGNVVTREGVSGFIAPAWGFSTKYQDKETGLLYYGYRYYDPVTGRWLSKDPIEEAGGINLYGFSGNDGVNRFDIIGLRIGPHDGSVEDVLGHALSLHNLYPGSNVARLMLEKLGQKTGAFDRFDEDQGRDYNMDISYLKLDRGDVIAGGRDGTLLKWYPELFKEICRKESGETTGVRLTEEIGFANCT